MRAHASPLPRVEPLRRLAGHLTALGLPDMTRGIDREAALSFHGL